MSLLFLVRHLSVSRSFLLIIPASSSFLFLLWSIFLSLPTLEPSLLSVLGSLIMFLSTKKGGLVWLSSILGCVYVNLIPTAIIVKLHLVWTALIPTYGFSVLGSLYFYLAQALCADEFLISLHAAWLSLLFQVQTLIIVCHDGCQILGRSIAQW